MRVFVVSLLLRLVRGFSRLFYSVDEAWIGDTPPEERWEPYRLVVILNHTSLFEFLYVAVCPDGFLRRMARDGVVPIAEKTVQRPFVGRFWRMIAGRVVPVTRERDETWTRVVDAAGREAMVIILPEGRMMRASGLDQKGKAMTIRGGIADLIGAMEDGKMLIAYSQGLHHVHTPDRHRLPRLFQRIAVTFEVIDLAEYRREVGIDEGRRAFRRAVVADLTARRDRHCPPPAPRTGSDG